METTTHCPSCNTAIYPTDNFCPNCGKALHTHVTISISKQLYMYAVSLLLPPLGLIWTFKYFHSGNAQLRRLGFITGAITIFSLVFSLWAFMGFWNSLQQQISTYSNLTY